MFASRAGQEIILSCFLYIDGDAMGVGE